VITQTSFSKRESLFTVKYQCKYTYKSNFKRVIFGLYIIKLFTYSILSDNTDNSPYDNIFKDIIEYGGYDNLKIIVKKKSILIWKKKCLL